MFKDLERKYTAIVLLIKPFVRQRSSSVSVVLQRKAKKCTKICKARVQPLFLLNFLIGGVLVFVLSYL